MSIGLDVAARQVRVAGSQSDDRVCVLESSFSMDVSAGRLPERAAQWPPSNAFQIRIVFVQAIVGSSFLEPEGSHMAL